VTRVAGALSFRSPAIAARHSVSSEKGLHSFPRGCDDASPGWDRPDEHRAIERRTCHEVGKLLGGVAGVRHAQQTDLSEVCEFRRQGLENLTGGPCVVFLRESRE
jgi:hypothetical protein